MLAQKPLSFVWPPSALYQQNCIIAGSSA